MRSELFELCRLSGVSGDEDRVREYIREMATPYADSMRTDAMGNLIVFKKGAKSTGNKLLIAAHMDEVGLIVTRITDDGFLKFDFVGGVDRRVAIGKPVVVGENNIPGIIGLKAIHLVRRDEMRKTPKTDALYIDIGAKNKEEAIDSLKNELKDLYSIGIDLEKALKNPDSDADVILRTGDVITVPVMNNTVKITGAVFYPNTVVYNPKYTWRDYINQAGGRRRNTKANQIYAVYMNGLVAKKGSSNFKMEPGMELVVTSEPKEDRKLSTAELVTIASSSTSIAYMITALVRMFI